MRTYAGRTLVDLREWYCKNEQPAPGKKGMHHTYCLSVHVMRFLHTCLSSFPHAGIALTEEQWGVVRTSAARISAALAAHDATFELPLGSERRVQVRVLVGSWGHMCRHVPDCQHSVLWDAWVQIYASACR